jgi:hypothetical protein
MKIIAIGKNPGDLETGCIGTLSRFQREGNEVYLVAAGKKSAWTKKMVKAFQELAHRIGTAQISYTERFDFAAVSQDNVNSLRAIVEPIKPSIAFFPFKRTPDSKNRVLSESSLLTCRDVENVLMYETSKNKNFTPNIFFDIYSGKHDNPKNKRSKKNTTIHRFYAQKAKVKDRDVETFASHRMILLNDHRFGETRNE